MRISVINTLNMYTHELREIVSRDIRLNRQFLGVFAADELPHQIPVGCLAIVNCCERAEPGQHWIAIYQEAINRLEMFDSYGLPPSAYNLQNKLPADVIVYNNRPLQGLFSNVCGQYCLYYCYFKARGYAMNDILSIFSNDFASNDYNVSYYTIRLFIN